MTKKERSWVLYDWANSAFSMTVLSVILPIFYKDVVAKELPSHLSTAYWGYGNSIATLLVAILAPILGTIAAYKGYKKKLFTFFLFLGLIFTSLFFIVNEGNWLLCIIIYIFAILGFSGSNIFYDSFLVDVTTEDRMDWISSAGFGYGYIGSTIPFIISIIFIMKPDLIGITTLQATKLSFLITSVWWFIFSLPMLKDVEQTQFIEPEKNAIKKSFIRLYDTFKNITQYKSIFLFLIAYFFYIDGVSTIIKMATIFGRDIGVSSNDLMIILLAIQFIAFPFALLFGKLAKKYSARKMILVGIGVYSFIAIYAYFMHTTIQFWILGFLVATSQGGIQALSRSYFGKIIPKDKASEFFGFYNIFGKFASILGPLLVAFVTQVTGNSRLGVSSIIILFLIGGFLFMKVPEHIETI
ncbi:MFS transporter [Clostridium grantii]|uniref:MFS transporter, UMF1 family n=1 Tax=Clostridium grantii DSM 8605 TaxID=1121316 RepID=A0A1M5T143_9CLOT|nr:MFS transporter [Clostridium grantii]SHH44382.1 MFS transporter, UMF1 family [Clostridium grantii DSM 8605]